MITRPLDLQARLGPPPRDLDFFAWVNVGLIALFFGLLGSRFVLAPGEVIDVRTGGSVVLPQGGAGLDLENAGQTSVVVSYRSDNVILFEGGKYALPELRKQMEAYTKQHPGSVMLVQADRQVSVQAFLDLCEMARAAGFARVIVAAEKPSAETGK
ncbi:MAG: ExbD/TolR family protein [Verrucomicrobiota bacterium]